MFGLDIRLDIFLVGLLDSLESCFVLFGRGEGVVEEAFDLLLFRDKPESSASAYRENKKIREKVMNSNIKHIAWNLNLS